MLVEGPLYRFRQYTYIFNANGDKRFHIYLDDRKIAVADSRIDAHNCCINHITAGAAKEMIHDGVSLYSFEKKDQLYLLTLKDTVFKDCNDFVSLDYGTFWRRKMHKYLHNKNTYALVCVDDPKDNTYYWEGEQLSEQNWKKVKFTEEFGNKFNKWLSE